MAQIASFHERKHTDPNSIVKERHLRGHEFGDDQREITAEFAEFP